MHKNRVRLIVFACLLIGILLGLSCSGPFLAQVAEGGNFKASEGEDRRLEPASLDRPGYTMETENDFLAMAALMSRSGFIEMNPIEDTEYKMIGLDIRYTRQYEVITGGSVVLDDDTLYTDETRVITEGQNGLRVLLYEETYKNGFFMGAKLISSDILQKPVQELILRGTKLRFFFAPLNRKTAKADVLASLAKISDSLKRYQTKSYRSFSDNGDGTISVDGEIYTYTTMNERTITMYDGLEVCLQNGCHTPPINHTTFCGVPAQRGIVAVAFNRVDGKAVGTALPIGTILFVEGYGLGVVGDLNGAKENLDLIDVCYDPGEIRNGTAKLGKIKSRVYILQIP